MTGDKPLWAGRFSRRPAAAMQAFGDSLPFDQRMWREDIAATAAHARALERAGILTPEERGSIEEALASAAAVFEVGTFVFDDADEDIHSAVERFLTDRLGDTGAKIHAGRSRNDLVATDFRLWLKGTTLRIAAGIHELSAALVAQAETHRDTLAPGYTHLQRAQPILFAHHLLAHAFPLARDFDRMLAAHRAADVSPLGAAAFAGTSLPLDPVATAADLGFAAVFDNAADAVSDRDFALEFLAAGAILGVHLSRLGEEIVLWTTSEFGFAVLDDAYAQGSSIMPQKKNPDIAELVRAKGARMTANLLHLLGVMKGLPLAYDKDLQEDKEPVFDTADTLAGALPVLAGLVATMTFDTNRLAAAVGTASAATDLAEWLVGAGVPFREAHHAVGSLVGRLGAEGRELSGATVDDLAAAHPAFRPEALERLDPRRCVEARRSHGGTAPERIADQLECIRAILQRQKSVLPGSEPKRIVNDVALGRRGARGADS
ncbi:MAG: argininosuccinate lyase [Actinobacteria bacterium]|nr:argininosuccinate lyase [Actinomycetota bacterium]